MDKIKIGIATGVAVAKHLPGIVEYAPAIISALWDMKDGRLSRDEAAELAAQLQKTQTRSTKRTERAIVAGIIAALLVWAGKKE